MLSRIATSVARRALVLQTARVGASAFNRATLTETGRHTISYSAYASDIQRIDQSTLPTMSQAVVHNGIVYVSGQIDTTGECVESQTRNVLAKIDALLEEAGTDKSKILTASIWLKDIERDFSKMNGVWLEWIDADNKPARATTEANMAFPNLLVEIQVSAAV